MNRTKIEWCDYTWNPIKGLCPVGCWYCYGRKLYKRFGEQIMGDYEDEDGGSSLDINTPFLANPAIEKFPKKAARIFVCSTFELFHPITKQWRDDIFRVIESHPEHTFIILTKLPQNIDRPMPENVFLGTTVTEMDDYLRKVYLFKAKARIRFVSYEPILGPMPPVFPIGLDWFIMGRLTGCGNGRNPELNTLKNIVEGCKDLRVPLFMKNNLVSIWPGKLIQEWPKG